MPGGYPPDWASRLRTKTVGMEEASRTIRLGLLAAPDGLAHDLAEELAEKVPDQLAESYGGTAWEVEVAEEPLAATTSPDVDLVGAVRRRMLDEGWDLAICLTERPLLVGRRPVTAQVSVAHGVALVSVPALGPLGLEERVDDVVRRLTAGLASEDRVAAQLENRTAPLGTTVVDRDRGTVRFATAVVTGNLRLLAGMVRANRPWTFVSGLSRALTGALGAGAFGMVSTGVWQVADGLAWLRLVALVAVAIAVTCASLVAAHGLWEHGPGRSAPPEARERVMLFNIATATTVVIGILTLYLALLAISLGCTLALIPDHVFASQLGHQVSLADYLRLALVVSLLATLGGALGQALESDNAVRAAAYGYRGDD
jgi:hypothetical protein